MNIDHPFPTICKELGLCSCCNGIVTEHYIVLPDDELMQISLRRCFTCGAVGPETKIMVMEKRPVMRV